MRNKLFHSQAVYAQYKNELTVGQD